MAPPKRDDTKGKGKASSSKFLVHKPSRPPLVNYGQFLDAFSFSNYKHYFTKRLVAMKRHVHEKTLFDMLIGYELVSDGWESLMTIKGEVQEEALRVFWSNIHDSSLKDLSFHTKVYGVPMSLDPSILSTLRGIARPTGKAVTFPLADLDKAVISEVFGRESTTWFGKL